jgi:hypothetical protein
MAAFVDQGLLRHHRRLAGTAALVSLLVTACGPMAETKSEAPARSEAPVAPSHVAAAVLINAERVDASFASIPASIADIEATNKGGRAAQSAALGQAAERAYREEVAGLRDKMLADVTVPADAAAVIRSLTSLAKAREAAAARPGTPERSKALDRALAARPNREGIVALAAAMAAPRFADERALTVRLMAWGLNYAGHTRRQASPSDVSEQVAEIMDKTRAAEDARTRAGAVATRRDPALLEALLALPAADIATLAEWYGSAAGKTAKDQMVGYFQGANERAGQRMLIDFLTRTEPEG